MPSANRPETTRAEGMRASPRQYLTMRCSCACSETACSETARAETARPETATTVCSERPRVTTDTHTKEAIGNVVGEARSVPFILRGTPSRIVYTTLGVAHGEAGKSRGRVRHFVRCVNTSGELGGDHGKCVYFAPTRRGCQIVATIERSPIGRSSPSVRSMRRCLSQKVLLVVAKVCPPSVVLNHSTRELFHDRNACSDRPPISWLAY